MQARRTWLFATRGMVAAAGLVFLLAAQPGPAGISSDRSDSPSFARQAYPVAAIMCGNRVVWLSRDMVQQQVGLSDPDDRPAAPPREQRGNRVHAGAAAPEGQD